MNILCTKTKVLSDSDHLSLEVCCVLFVFRGNEADIRQIDQVKERRPAVDNLAKVVHLEGLFYENSCFREGFNHGLNG